jgi:hypothetical protein
MWDGKEFEAWVATTDTDLMEQGALLSVPKHLATHLQISLAYLPQSQEQGI